MRTEEAIRDYYIVLAERNEGAYPIVEPDITRIVTPRRMIAEGRVIFSFTLLQFLSHASLFLSMKREIIVCCLQEQREQQLRLQGQPIPEQNRNNSRVTDFASYLDEGTPVCSFAP